MAAKVCARECVRQPRKPTPVAKEIIVFTFAQVYGCVPVSEYHMGCGAVWCNQVHFPRAQCGVRSAECGMRSAVCGFETIPKSFELKCYSQAKPFRLAQTFMS